MEYTFDGKNKSVGRLASEIAEILQGKKHASYDPRLEGDDRVRVTNVTLVKFTGKKMSQKIYYRHAGKLGHLKRHKVRDVFEKKPAWILRHAVYSMLPKNRLRTPRIKRLTIER